MPEIFVKNEFFGVDKSVEMVLEELRQAFEKHPKFCDKFTQQTLIHARYDERVLKRKNEEAPFFADRILLEELAEAGTRPGCRRCPAHDGALRLNAFCYNKPARRVLHASLTHELTP